MKTPDDLFTRKAADGPLILSVPHAGTLLPLDIARRLSPQARGLPDTDWYVDDLYDFAGDIGATLIAANYSRYVIDLNRPPDNQSLYPGHATTGLCPPIMFDGTPIYADGGEVSPDEVAARRTAFWQPYHDRLATEIARAKARHGFALLYDCHSIASQVPRLFDGLLPVLNLGTVGTTSCDRRSSANWPPSWPRAAMPMRSMAASSVATSHAPTDAGGRRACGANGAWVRCLSGRGQRLSPAC